MTKLQATTKFAIAAVALTTLLSACSGTTTDPTSPATTPAASTPVEQPTLEESPTPTEVASETPTEMPTEETTPVETPSEPQGPTPPTTGPLTGAKLDAAGVKWFGAYCTGVKNALSHVSPNTSGMTLKEAQQTAVDTYAKLGEALKKAGADLGALDGTMNFEGSAEFAQFVVKTLADVGDVYTAGSADFAAATFTKESEMTELVQSIEAKAVESGSSGFGVNSLDDTVKQSVASDVPECTDA